MINPKNNLINVEDGPEKVPNGLNEEHFFPSTKDIEDKIAEYNAIPTKYFINEKFFI